MAGAIAVQAFNKADTIVATLESVAKCRGSQNYNLIILQDGWLGSKHAQKDCEAQSKTYGAIESWVKDHRNHFRSVLFRQLERNYGAYSVAERLITHGFEKSAFVIFSEDDVIFEEDAIRWFERVRVHPGFLRSEVWAVAGESKFFDSQRRVPSSEEIEQALEVAQREKLVDRFIYYDFLPSSCFATTREKWAEFGRTRGAPNGDRDVNLRCRAERKLCLWPAVARCRDTGMHHPHGLSVRYRGPDHLGFKNTYIVSGILDQTSESNLIELSQEKMELFHSLYNEGARESAKTTDQFTIARADKLRLA
jgi:hypothetical protein